MKTVWVTIGIINRSRQIVVMGVSATRTEAQQKGDDRKEQDQVDSWQVFLFDGDMGDRLNGWFKKKGLTREQRVHAIRGIGKFFDEVTSERKLPH